VLTDGTVSWAAPASDEPIVGYRTQTDCGFQGDGVVLGPDERSLELFTTGACIVQVAALTATVAGATATLVTSAGATLPTPRATVIERTATSVTLALQIPPTVDAPVDMWAVSVFDATAASGVDYVAPGSAAVSIAPVGDNDAIATITGLSESRTHLLRVMARSSSAEEFSAWTAPISATTLSGSLASVPVLDLSGSGASIVLDARGLEPSSVLTARFAIPGSPDETADVTGTVGVGGRVWARIPVPSVVPDGAFGSVSVEALTSDGPRTQYYSFPVDKAAFLTASTPVILSPKIEGVGAVHTVDLGVWDPRPTTIGYQWLRDGQPIEGATASTYALALADQGRGLSVSVTADRAGFESTVRTSASVSVGTFPVQAEPISGRAVATDGTPLVDMTVRLHAADAWEWAPPLATVATAADGTFIFDTVDPGSYLVEVLDPAREYAAVWSGGAYWRDQAEPVVIGYGGGALGDLALPRVAVLAGTVAFDGVPQLYAQLRIERADSDESVPGVLIYWDSDTSTFEVGGLPPGEYRIAAASYQSYTDPSAPSYMGEWWENATSRLTAEVLVLGEGQTIGNLDFDLSPGAQLQGTVLDSRGEPIENIAVTLLNPDGRDQFAPADPLAGSPFARTGADGSWTLSNVPVGEWIVQADPEYFPWFGMGSPFQMGWYGSSVSPQLADRVIVGQGATITDLDVVLADRDPSIPIAEAPASMVYDPATGALTWDEPASTLPVVGYWGLMGSLWAGGDIGASVLDDRRLQFPFLVEGTTPTLIVLQALTANGPGAPAIVAVNPPGAEPAPTVAVSAVTPFSFDVTVTAPPSFSGGIWEVYVYEANGDDRIEVIGYGEGPGPASITRTVEGLDPESGYRIVAVIGDETDNRHSSYAVVSTETSSVGQPGPFAVAPVPTIDAPAEFALGSELTALPGTWSPVPILFAYQWLRDGVPIEGATNETYTLTYADQFSAITVQVTASRTGVLATERVSEALVVGEFLAVAEEITGRVLDADGMPLGGMTVRVHDALTGEWNPAVAVTDTAPDGSFVVDPVEPGLYLVEVSDPGSQYASVWSGGAYWRDQADMILVGFGDAGVGDLVMPIGATLTGSVAFDGAPQLYAALRLERAADAVWLTGSHLSWDESARTFAFAPLPPGEYRLAALTHVPFPDSDATGYSGEWWQEASTSSDATDIVLDPGQTVSGLDFDLAPAPRLSGTVRDSDGEPVEGVWVTLLDPDGRNADNWFTPSLQHTEAAQTAADGTWELRAAPPGEWVIEFGTEFDPWYPSTAAPLQSTWWGSAVSPATATIVVLEAATRLADIDVTLADRDPNIPPAQAPTLTLDPSTGVVEWSTPSSTLPVVGYEYLQNSIWGGGILRTSVFDPRQFSSATDSAGEPMLVTVRAFTANGPGAPAILAIKPPGSAPAPTVTVSNRSTRSFDLSLTAPSGWEDAIWNVTVYSAQGDQRVEVLGFQDGPLPGSVSRTVTGLNPDASYRIVAAVGVEGENGDDLLHSSWSVTTVQMTSLPLFSDVAPGSQFAAEISWLADSGVTRGFPDNTFRPLASVNRDAMAAFLYRFAGEPAFTPPAVSPFSDVPTSNQFYKEITWLRSTGITTGYPDGTFRPLAPIGRDAMAAFLYRFAGEPAFTPPAVSPFVDMTPSTQFYREVTWMRSVGITTGFPDRTFRPGASIARDAMAAFLFRFDDAGLRDR
jgi:protocatechuate 3,4-dioxygenase beta subunit